MPGVCAEDFLGPFEPFLFVAVFQHPSGDLEASIEITRVFEQART